MIAETCELLLLQREGRQDLLSENIQLAQNSRVGQEFLLL
jgi:hypothetical protein